MNCIETILFSFHQAIASLYSSEIFPLSCQFPIAEQSISTLPWWDDWFSLLLSLYDSLQPPYPAWDLEGGWADRLQHQCLDSLLVNAVQLAILFLDRAWNIQYWCPFLCLFRSAVLNPWAVIHFIHLMQSSTASVSLQWLHCISSLAFPLAVLLPQHCFTESQLSVEFQVLSICWITELV